MSSLQKALEKSHVESPVQIGVTTKKKKDRTRKNARTVTTKPKIVVSTPAYSSSDDSSSCSSDESSVDAKEEEQKQQHNNYQEEDGEDMIKIRQQAFNLLNKSSGHIPTNEESKGFISSYQQQSAGENSINNSSPSYQSSSPYAMHNPHAHPNARTADKMSMTDLFVNCVSDVCRSSSSEILSKGVALVSAGYKSVSDYGDKPVNGTFDSIDTSQHGYGNTKNHAGGYPARYQD